MDADNPTVSNVLADAVTPETRIEFYARDRWHANTHLMGLGVPDAHSKPVLAELSQSDHAGPFYIVIVAASFDAEPSFLVRPFEFVQV